MLMEEYDRTVRKLTQRSPRSIACGVVASFAAFVFLYDMAMSSRTVTRFSDAMVDQLMGAVAKHLAVHTESVELHGLSAAHVFRRMHLDNDQFSLDGLVLRNAKNFEMLDFQNEDMMHSSYSRGLLVEAVSPPALVVDVGAGVGRFALFAASEGFRVRAVEMHADVCAMLEMSKRINGFTRMAVTNARVGTNATRLDDVSPEGASFLRIDARGCEKDIIESAGDLLQLQLIPHVAIECATGTSGVIEERMKGMGYGCSAHRENGNQSTVYCLAGA